MLNSEKFIILDDPIFVGVDLGTGADSMAYSTVNFQSGKTTIWPERYTSKDLSNMVEDSKKKAYLQSINELAINTEYEYVQS